jgi:hypothetical protein
MKTMIRAVAAMVTLAAAAPLFATAESWGSARDAPRWPTATDSNAARVRAIQTQLAAADAARKRNDEVSQQLFQLQQRTVGDAPVLVIPAGEMSGDALAAAHEDMNVMSRILAGSLKQTGAAPSATSALGDLPVIGALNSPIASGIEGLYLQGYGVLFTMKVGFPLAPGPDSNEPKEEPAKTGDDSVWQKTKDELYQPLSARVGTSVGGQEKYSAERVESLKTAIITALKHAANIRGLQPADSAVVTVVGRSARTIVATIDRGPDGWMVVDSAGAKTLYTNLPKNFGESAPPAVLTIRAKMSDVAAFAKGTVTLDQFRQKVQILSMPYLGNTTGGREGRGGRGGLSTGSLRSTGY